MASNKIRIHIHLFEDDWNKMGVIFGSSIGRSQAVRDIVHDYIKRISAKTGRTETPMELKDDEFDNILTGLTSQGDQRSEH